MLFRVNYVHLVPFSIVPSFTKMYHNLSDDGLTYSCHMVSGELYYVFIDMEWPVIWHHGEKYGNI